MALTLAAGLTSAGAALAQGDAGAGLTRHGRGNGCFERSDTDADGRVTRAEARAAKLSMFDRFDANHDASLSRAEALLGARRWRQRRLAEFFAARDQDGDGALAAAELGRLGNRLMAWDADADGRLTQRELRRAYASRRAGEWGEAALSGSMLRRDFNADGRIARTEAARAAEQRFARRDRNGDGVLTRVEAGLDPPGPR